MNLNKFWSKQMKRLASVAMRMPSDLGSSGLGSVQRRETNETCSLKNWKNEKKEAVLNSVKLVKRKIQISYK